MGDKLPGLNGPFLVKETKYDIRITINIERKFTAPWPMWKEDIIIRKQQNGSHKDILEVVLHALEVNDCLQYCHARFTE